jgi:hypothetical protein
LAWGLLVDYLVMSFRIFLIRQSVIHAIPDELLEAEPDLGRRSNGRIASMATLAGEPNIPFQPYRLSITISILAV